MSKEFLIQNGVRQGDVLAPTLFNLFFDAVIAMALTQYSGCGLKLLFNQEAKLVGSRRKMVEELVLHDLEYADDMVLVSVSMDALEELLHAMEASCCEMGLTISTRKTKILAIRPAVNPSQPPREVLLRPIDDPVSVVEDFEYLGSAVSADCSLDKEISSRISKASRSFNSLCRVLWYQRRVKTRTKMRLFKSVVLSTLLYGSETWAPTATHVKRLQGFIMMCVWVILGVSRWEQKRNTELRAMAGLERVEVMLMRRRLRWLGHVARMEGNRIPKCLLVCKPFGGKRSAGGQKRRWNDVIVEDLKKCELYPNWREQVEDRSTWRGLINAAAEDVNEEMEAKEQSKKDELKRRRDGISQEQSQCGWECAELGCGFVGQSKAGLMNHFRQKHGRAAQERQRCPHCEKLFQKQGITMHMRYCMDNPAKRTR